MSEYAEIENGKVIRVVVINDSWTEKRTANFLTGISINTWIKTTKKVGKTYEYHRSTKSFTPKKPFKSWSFDKKSKMYLPPIPRPLAIPVGFIVIWSQKLKRWVIKEK